MEGLEKFLQSNWNSIFEQGASVWMDHVSPLLPKYNIILNEMGQFGGLLKPREEFVRRAAITKPGLVYAGDINKVVIAFLREFCTPWVTESRQDMYRRLHTSSGFNMLSRREQNFGSNRRFVRDT